MISFKGNVYTYGRLFSEDAYFDFTGYTLVRSNGTSEGTVVVKDAFTSTWGSYPRKMISINNNQFVFMRVSGYLADYDYLWVTNGTTAGTVKLGDMPAEYSWQKVGNALYYTIYGSTMETSGDWELWKSMGTPETTVKVTGQVGDWTTYPQGLTDVNGSLYYFDVNGTIWKTSGAPPVQLADLDQVYSITNVGGTAFILGENAGIKSLWKTTTSGIQKVKDVGVIPEALRTLAIGNIFYFLGLDGFFLGVEVFIFDIDGNRLPVIVSEGIFDTQGIELLLANKIDGIVGGDPEKPCTKSKIFLELVKASEGFRKRFDGKVFSIIDIANHFKDHVINCPLVPL